MDTTITGKQLVAGAAPAESDEVFVAIDPASGQPLEPTFQEAGAEEIDTAFEQAAAAAKPMRGFPPARNAELLEAVARALEAVKGALIARCRAETGLPPPRLEMEFGRMVNQMRLFAQVVREGSWLGARIDHGDPGREPLPKPDVRRVMAPVGPVAVFGASNFPLALSVAGGDTASALGAGNPVVIKGHPSHPGTCEIAARAAQAAVQEVGFPAGTLSLLQGATPEVGQAMVRHPLCRAVGFTGSLQAGRALFDTVSRRPQPIPIYAEMGSVNPLFVLGGKLAADPAGVAEGLFASFTLGNGQFCTKPGLVFLPQADGLDAFVERLGELAREHPGATLLNTGIERAFGAGIDRWEASEDVEMLARGSLRADDVTVGAAPALARTTAAAFSGDADRFQEEVFGPAALLVVCPQEDDFPTLAAGFNGQLTATVLGTEADLEDAAQLLDALAATAGRVVINGYPTGVEVCHAMHHGGPYPATFGGRDTSIGTAAISRFVRPVCYQNTPAHLLPPTLQDGNPLGIPRLVDGEWQLPDAG